jgi:hypothetical protein
MLFERWQENKPSFIGFRSQAPPNVQRSIPVLDNTDILV